MPIDGRMANLCEFGDSDMIDNAIQWTLNL